MLMNSTINFGVYLSVNLLTHNLLVSIKTLLLSHKNNVLQIYRYTSSNSLRSVNIRVEIVKTHYTSKPL